MMRLSMLMVPLLLAGACDDDTSKPLPVYDLSVVKDLSLPAPADLSVPTNPPIEAGLINIYSYSYTVTPGGLISGGGVSVSFTTTTYGLGLTCLKSTVAGCQVQHCSGNLFDETQTDDNGGAITVTIGAKTYMLSANPDMGNNYNLVSGTFGSPFFNSGDSIVVTPTGAAAVTLTGTAEPTITAPAIPAPGTPLSIDSSADATFTYTGDFTNAKVRTQFGSGTGATSTIVTCENTLAATVTVAKAALQELDKGPNATFSQTIYTASPAFMLAGHSTIVQASNALLLPDGSGFNGATATVK